MVEKVGMHWKPENSGSGMSSPVKNGKTPDELLDSILVKAATDTSGAKIFRDFQAGEGEFNLAVTAGENMQRLIQASRFSDQYALFREIFCQSLMPLGVLGNQFNFGMRIGLWVPQTFFEVKNGKVVIKSLPMHKGKPHSLAQYITVFLEGVKVTESFKTAISDGDIPVARNVRSYLWSLIQRVTRNQEPQHTWNWLRNKNNQAKFRNLNPLWGLCFDTLGANVSPDDDSEYVEPDRF